jgi:hypothetical protein
MVGALGIALTHCAGRGDGGLFHNTNQRQSQLLDAAGRSRSHPRFDRLTRHNYLFLIGFIRTDARNPIISRQGSFAIETKAKHRRILCVRIFYTAFGKCYTRFPYY